MTARTARRASRPARSRGGCHNGEQTYKEWLTSTPSQETEVLFHGNDLDKYRTKEVKNPYLPKRKK